MRIIDIMFYMSACLVGTAISHYVFFYEYICQGLGVTANGVVYHTSFYYGA